MPGPRAWRSMPEIARAVDEAIKKVTSNPSHD